MPDRMPDRMVADPAEVVAAARERGWMLATAESLTAGAVVARLVDVPGASAAVAGGAACYSYAAKHRVLGVDADELERTGAVTSSVAEAMARGALALYDADLAVSTTGVAGPGPDERGVPEGTVWIGLARRGGAVRSRRLSLAGSREQVRASAVDAAVRELLAALRADAPSAL
ncbi:CinA family protein [Brachybacterium sp. DNPG3]